MSNFSRANAKVVSECLTLYPPAISLSDSSLVFARGGKLAVVAELGSDTGESIKRSRSVEDSLDRMSRRKYRLDIQVYTEKK